VVKEVTIFLATVTWFTLVKIRMWLAVLVAWWAAIQLGFQEVYLHPLLQHRYFAWGLAARAALIWVFAVVVLANAWIKRIGEHNATKG
jgi:hypothetical protein